MKRYFHFLAISIVLMSVLSKPSFPQSSSPVEIFGLQGKRVIALDMAKRLSPQNAFLYAITEDEGVYRRTLTVADTAWQALGLQGKMLTALDIQVWGVGPQDFHTPVVGVSPDITTGDSTLIYRYENEAWVAVDSGIANKDVVGIRALESFESSGHLPPGDAFAGGNARVYRGHSLSIWWQEVYNSGGDGMTNTIATSPAAFINGDVWAGGETGFFAPWIARSTDSGLSWDVFYPDLSGDNACNSLAVHPEAPNIVYAGMEGAVIKTTDSGITWEVTNLHDMPVYFRGLALDSSNPDHIYAGGVNSPRGSWALWESFDAGASWQEIQPPSSDPATIISGITRIVADRETPATIYIATFGDGVWKYQSMPTGIDQQTVPDGFVLEQNYPNPFNPLDNFVRGYSARHSVLSNGVNPETEIRYQLPSAQHVKLSIYNLQGQFVAKLVDQSQLAGEHRVRWDGKDDMRRFVPSGVYFYRLSAGSRFIAVRKMLLVR